MRLSGYANLAMTVFMLLATSACTGFGRHWGGSDYGRPESERLEVTVRVSPIRAESLGENLRQGVTSTIERAGNTDSSDIFNYVLQIVLRVETDTRDRRSPVGYLDADARIVRLIDGHIVASEHFWQVHRLGDDGLKVLTRKSEGLGRKVAKWALQELP